MVNGRSNITVWVFVVIAALVLACGQGKESEYDPAVAGKKRMSEINTRVAASAATIFPTPRPTSTPRPTATPKPVPTERECREFWSRATDGFVAQGNLLDEATLVYLAYQDRRIGVMEMSSLASDISTELAAVTLAAITTAPSSLRYEGELLNATHLAAMAAADALLITEEGFPAQREYFANRDRFTAAMAQACSGEKTALPVATLTPTKTPTATPARMPTPKPTPAHLEEAIKPLSPEIQGKVKAACAAAEHLHSGNPYALLIAQAPYTAQQGEEKAATNIIKTCMDHYAGNSSPPDHLEGGSQ